MKDDLIFSVSNRIGLVIGASNLLDGERLKIQFSVDINRGEHTWADYYPDGKDVYIDNKCNPIKIYEEGFYKAVPDGDVNDKVYLVKKPLFIGVNNGYNS
mgnify:CR=1 FL=1